MKDYKFGLFYKRRFLPMFLAQFLGAFNDNLLRSGLVVLIAYAHERGISLPMENQAILVTICPALLILPFIIFSSLAGGVADKYEKARLVSITKLVEIGIMLTAFYGFATNNIVLLMAMLFVSGTHSTFFGPLKYSILPDHLRPGELLAGNGFIVGGTYMGILSGLIVGGLLVVEEGNLIGFTAIGVAVAGFIASLFIPRAEATAPDTHIHFRLVRGTIDLVRHAISTHALRHSIVGISWFLTVGSIFMAQFPNYAGQVMRADNQVYILFLCVFSVGVALGSIIVDKLLKGDISARNAPWALAGVSLFIYIMVFTTPVATHENLLTVQAFLADSSHWPLLASMLLVAMCGGIYMVPLYAILQHHSEATHRSRIIAASNLCDSLLMTVAAVICAGLLALGFSIPDLFFIVATVNLLVCVYARRAVAHRA